MRSWLNYLRTTKITSKTFQSIYMYFAKTSDSKLELLISNKKLLNIPFLENAWVEMGKHT